MAKESEPQVSDLAIVIKSARRPWALDRLLTSLDNFLVNPKGLEIHVVDDRTESVYLREIVRRHPCVTQVHHADWGQSQINSLPYVEAWRRVVGKLKVKWVLILEDDQWLTCPLDLDSELNFVRLQGVWCHWLGVESKDLTHCFLSADASSQNILYFPRILLGKRTELPKVGTLAKVLATTNPIGRKLASILTVFFPKFFSPRWRSLAMLNPMCGAIFDRHHWLDVWHGPMARIDENLQISKILSKVALEASPQGKFAATPKKFFETTFVSSVSLSLGVPLDWNAANKAWSREWLNGGLETLNPTDDWDKAVLANILKDQLGPSVATTYLEWTDKFAKLHGHV